MKEKGKQFLIWLLWTVGLVAVDQLVKKWTVQRLMAQPPIALWPGVFELTYVENRGAAFGILQNQQWLFSILTIAVMMALIFVYFRLGTGRRFRLTRICCVGVLAGAAGNLIDRLMRRYVIDTFYFKLIDFPVFNVADCYVVVFGILFCISAIFQKDLLENISDQVLGRNTGSHGTKI